MNTDGPHARTVDSGTSLVASTNPHDQDTAPAAPPLTMLAPAATTWAGVSAHNEIKKNRILDQGGSVDAPPAPAFRGALVPAAMAPYPFYSQLGMMMPQFTPPYGLASSTAPFFFASPPQPPAFALVGGHTPSGQFRQPPPTAPLRVFTVSRSTQTAESELMSAFHQQQQPLQRPPPLFMMSQPPLPLPHLSFSGMPFFPDDGAVSHDLEILQVCLLFL